MGRSYGVLYRAPRQWSNECHLLRRPVFSNAQSRGSLVLADRAYFDSGGPIPVRWPYARQFSATTVNLGMTAAGFAVAGKLRWPDPGYLTLTGSS